MTTWNPSDKSTSITLSGGNLIATVVSAGGGKNVRTTDSHSTGKWYMEAVMSSINTGGPILGLYPSTMGLESEFPGADPGEGVGLMFSNDATFKVSRWVNGSTVQLDSTAGANSDVVMMAVDYGAGKIWFGRNGTWYGSTGGGAAGDPAAGTNPAYTGSEVTGSTYACAAGQFGTSVITGRFTVSAFSYSPPSGFSAWDGTTAASVGTAAGTSTAQAYTNLSAGLAAGTSTATAAGGAGVGASAGTSTASAEGAAVHMGAGASVGKGYGSAHPIVTPNKYAAVNPAVIVTAVRGDTGLQWGTADYPIGNSDYATYLLNDGFVDVPGVNVPNAMDFKQTDVYFPYGIDITLTLPSPRWLHSVRVWGGSGTSGTPDASLGNGVYDINMPFDVYVDGVYIKTSKPPGGGGVYNGTGYVATTVYFADYLYATEIKLVRVTSWTPINWLKINEVEVYGIGERVIDILISTANITATAIPVTVVYASSTANVTSSIDGFEVQTEVSTANITSNVGSQSDVHGQLVSTVNATSSAAGKQTLFLSSTANVTSVVPIIPTVATYVSTANITSSAGGLITRVNTLVSTANATSSAEGVLSYTATSTANVTSIADGIRVATETDVSTANVTSSVGSSSNSVELALVSTANVTSSVSGGHVVAHATLVSTANIQSFVILPGLPGGVAALWCNPITHAAASWSGTPFESVIEVDGVMYGAGQEGIYKMEDTLEEDVTIDSYVTWDLLDFGDPRKHRPGDFMIDGFAGAPLKVTVANEQGRYDYLTHLPKNTKSTNFRARLGKGLNSRHLRFTVANTKSKEFWFDGADIEVIQLGRHIGGHHG